MKRYITALILATSITLPQASGVGSAWYMGNWGCNIDNRAGQMIWKIVDASRVVCGGGVCSDSANVAVKGWFKDGSGGWVPLINRSTSGNDLRFTYTGDYTRWFLRYDPNTGIATGNTMWRGNTFPLQCFKDVKG